MCRHTVGLNYTAIGIEHVGFSDGEILRNTRQMAASLRLTRWLRCRYGIGVNNVIGHSESLSSPYHRERVERLKTPDARRLDAREHADLPRAACSIKAHAEYVGCMRIAAASVLTLLVFVVADAADAATRPRLKAFDDCRSLVDYARSGALRTQGGVGVDGRAAPPMVDAVVTPQIAPPRERTSNDTATSAPMPVSARGRDAVGGTIPEFSGTNVQELGVDEPDILKTDGRRIFAVTDRMLRVVDPASGQVTGTLALDGFGHRLLLRGDRVLVVASKGGTVASPESAGPSRRRSRRSRAPRSSPSSTSPPPRRR